MVFNEVLLFCVFEEKLFNCVLKIFVNYYNVMGKSCIVGEVSFSVELIGFEDMYWFIVILKYDKLVIMWYILWGFKFMELGRDDRL